MRTLELAPQRRPAKWQIAAMLGTFVAYAIFSGCLRYLPAADGAFFPSQDILPLLSGTLLAILVTSYTSSTTLEVSNPPVLVKTEGWLFLPGFAKCTVMENVVWVRAVYACTEVPRILVDVGTRGYETTSLVCLSYTEENLAVAEQLCARIAAALRIEGKGYCALA